VISLALTRVDIGNYVAALFEVYILLIFIYILANMLFTLGVRPPYSRYTDMVLGFLRDVSEPYLRLFRKLLPPIGGFDFTPMIAIIVLVIASRVLSSAISGQ
jgi:uncharacterized protein YggT (Ycf19 family)